VLSFTTSVDFALWGWRSGFYLVFDRVRVWFVYIQLSSFGYKVACVMNGMKILRCCVILPSIPSGFRQKYNSSITPFAINFRDYITIQLLRGLYNGLSTRLCRRRSAPTSGRPVGTVVYSILVRSSGMQGNLLFPFDPLTDP
jgi:hypothetical protein